VSAELKPISVSVATMAEILGISKDLAYDIVNAGHVKSAKAGARVLVDYQSLLDYFESIRRPA
jgi:excisionase family DNA binding protein